MLPTLPDLGRRLVAFENELSDAIFLHQPDLIGIEAPLLGGKGSAHTMELLICLAGIAEATAYRWERRFVRRAASTLRSQVCGRHILTDKEADRGLSVKEAVVAPWVAKQGWQITDHNSCDAAVGWAFEQGVRAPNRRKANGVVI